MEKLLLTGVDTLVGANLALSWRDRYQVVTLGDNSQPHVAGCTSLVVDMNDPGELKYHVQNEAPGWIVHCGPLSHSAWEIPLPLNRLAAEPNRITRWAEVADETGVRLAVVSTDAVFSGPRLFHSEVSPATACGALAETARTVERLLASTPALLVRTHAYGWSGTGEGCFVEQIWQRLTTGARCPVDAQNHATPILATDLADLLALALDHNLHGIWHLTGAERTSQYRFAAELAVAFGVTGRQVLLEPPALRTSRPFHAETSLNTSAARRELKATLPMLREGLQRFVEQGDNGYRQELESLVANDLTLSHAA